jgi:hypothetical protein
MPKQLMRLRCSSTAFEICKHSSFEMTYGYARLSTGAEDLTGELANSRPPGAGRCFATS